MKFFALLAAFAANMGLGNPIKPNELTMDQWIARQSAISVSAIEQGITPAGGLPGAMVASPSSIHPDYRFHWVRDSALTYLTVFRLYEAASGSFKQKLMRYLMNFASFSAYIQASASSLGEPKFYINGQPFTGGWCRPQNDGAALRAIMLMKFAGSLIENGQDEFARTNLVPVIRNDLNFVKTVWNQSSCDLWEELSGQHFYTLIVQRRALLDGAAMGEFLGQDSKELTHVASQIGSAILNHWSPDKGYFVATLNQTDGLGYKTSNLDASIILGILHGHTYDGFLPYTDPRVLATAERLMNVFSGKFSINQIAAVPGVAIGRYPEDMYAGTNFNGGNPWVLLTAALSRYYYLAGEEAKSNGDSSNAVAYRNRAEALMQRLKYHAPADGIWAEQMDRDTGFMTSAPNLIWSHVEVLEAFAARSSTGN